VATISAAAAPRVNGLEVREVGSIDTPRYEGTVSVPKTTVPPTVVSFVIKLRKQLPERNSPNGN